jgi:urease accessory protein
MDTGTEWLPFVLQTSDPLFPTGAYAHSFGLEEMVRLALVRDEESLRSFLQRQVVPALSNFELPYVRWSRDVARAGDVEELCRMDREIDAAKLCRELREASAQIGGRRLIMLLKLRPAPVIERFEERRASGDTPGHHAVVLGVQMRAVPLEAALLTVFYQTMAGMCGAALKLIRIGQEGCQRVLGDCLAGAGAAVERSMGVARGEAGWFNPLIEIASMRHETACERLFIS